MRKVVTQNIEVLVHANVCLVYIYLPGGAHLCYPSKVSNAFWVYTYPVNDLQWSVTLNNVVSLFYIENGFIIGPEINLFHVVRFYIHPNYTVR